MAGISILILMTAALFAAAWQYRRAAAALVRLESLAGTLPRGPLARRIDAAAAVLAPRSEPRAERHTVTGLPTREPLLAAIRAQRRGTLALLALADHDRLAAFDPALAERVLQTTVERLVRMVGPDRLVAQIDRGRFALWFGGAAGIAEAEAQLVAIAYALGDAIPGEDGTAIVPDIATACAHWPDDGANPAALLDRAVAMLTLGAQGTAAPAGVAAATAAARDRYLLEQDLRQAIDRAEFRLLYQPLIDARAGIVTGAEALIRWHHPTRGTVSPAVFIPVVEAMGMAGEVGAWVLNTALREVRAWPAGMRVAVNISGHQLERGDLRMLVERTLARHAQSPDRLVIELTESVATTDTARAAALFDALRAMGVRIAIDDFGTGFSSFSALRRLRFDKIKIDREFVTEVDRRRDSQAICQAIIALARGLDIGVLAEGVETVEEYQWLTQNGCHYFQGFHFSKPLTGATFANFHADRAGLAALLAGNESLMAAG